MAQGQLGREVIVAIAGVFTSGVFGVRVQVIVDG